MARHLDTCCATYDAVPSSALAADECLIAYPWRPTDPALVERCVARNRGHCETVDCADLEPSSRVAIDDGHGGCRYGAE